MVMVRRTLSLLLYCVLVSGCQSATVRESDKREARAGPPSRPNARPEPPLAGNVEQTIIENDRLIADNQRMIDAMAAYSRSDPRKLERLTIDCQKTIGTPSTREIAVRNFECIKSAW